MIIDYKALNGRTTDYWQAQQILDNPDILNDIAERSAIAMNKIWKHYKKKNIQRQKLTKFMDQQERGKIISDLARKGIFTDVDTAEIFIKTGAWPSDLQWYTEDSRVHPLRPEDNPKIWKTINLVMGNYQKSITFTLMRIYSICNNSKCINI